MKNLDGKSISHLPICGIYAVAHLSGQPIQVVYDYIKNKFKRGNAWKGSTKWCHRESALKKFGVKYKEFKTPKYTLKSFVEDTKHMNRKFLVSTTGHTQVVDGSLIIDQGGIFPVEEHWGKNKRVRKVQIIAKGK